MLQWMHGCSKKYKNDIGHMSKNTHYTWNFKAHTVHVLYTVHPREKTGMKEEGAKNAKEQVKL